MSNEIGASGSGGELCETETAIPTYATPRDERQEDYDEHLAALNAATEQRLYKIDGDGRITDPSREQAREKWVDSLVRMVKERRQLLKTRRIEELADELERSKATFETDLGK